MTSFTKKINLDKVGMTTSMLCAIHCISLPILLSIGLAGSVSWMDNHLLEWCLIGLAIVIAASSFIHSYYQKHNSLVPIVIAVLACSLLLASGFVGHGLQAHILSAAGGITLAIGHYVNWMLVRKV